MSSVEGPPGTTEDVSLTEAGSLQRSLDLIDADPEEEAQNDTLVNTVCPFYSVMIYSHQFPNSQTNLHPQKSVMCL